MRKQLMTGLVIVAAGYSAATLAASGNIAGSGNIGSGAWGTDNFVQVCATGCNPGESHGLGEALANATYKKIQLHFTDGLLRWPDDKLFTGRTTNGDSYKDGKKI